ncbi:MAG: DUF4153 domain-containing protein [Chlorobi bacterium]|nr:MAG: hypothetical protein UZ07_CHB004003422 [Chlorobi bacterium OLB7]MBK8911340.1 DUF4153 domain-containing protein [Chlorobiota bacterium]MBX7217718.1 DUF4153 domain-containing protein [Candidatus Kapabacteria bacterium]
MRLPSLRHLLDTATGTLRRFPLVLITSAGAAVAIMAETRQHRIPVVLGLGISLLFAIATIAERRGWNMGKSVAANLLGIGLLLLYFFLLPTGDLELPDVIRFALFALSAHLFCAFGPFVGRGYGDGFWKYNQTLFLRSLTAALFSLTLYAGLGLAVLAAEKLLGFEPYKNVYLDLFCLIAGVFNTWFFLAGVPRDVGALAGETDYPKGLKIFSQYVLIPLVAIYALILYLYSAKILLSWSWPIGWTSMPVFVFSVAGILAFLLLYPIRQREGERWVATYARWFFYLLLPLTSLPVLALWRRIGDYGITEERYLGLALAIWLALLAIGMIATRQRSIRAIPISLCIVAALATYGPWSATTLSIDSQTARLEQLLSNNGLLKNGKILPTVSAPYPADEDDIRELLWFLQERDGLEGVQQWFGSEANTMTTEQMKWKLGVADPSEYEHLGKPYASVPRPVWKMLVLQTPITEARPIDVVGFAFYVRLQTTEKSEWQTPVGVVAFDSQSGIVSLITAAGDTVKLNVAERALQLADVVKSGTLPPDDGHNSSRYEKGQGAAGRIATIEFDDSTAVLDNQQPSAQLVAVESSAGKHAIRCTLRELRARISPDGRQVWIESIDADVVVR